MSSSIYKVYNKVLKFIFVLKTYGTSGVLKLIKGFFKKHTSLFEKGRITIDIDSRYVLANKKVVGLKKQLSKKRLAWIVPDFGIGSGGHVNIFRFIAFLEKNGFENDIYMYGQLRYKNSKVIKHTINTYFSHLKSNVYIWSGKTRDSSAVMATSWDTVYPASTITNTNDRMYFVQDFEPYFFPLSSQAVLAEQTYKLGFKGICAGDWLSNKLNTEFGMPTTSYSFASESSYKNLPLNTKRKNRVLFYARPPTPRRGFELGILGLKLFNQINPDVEINLAGWDTQPYKIPFVTNHFGNVDLANLPKLYHNHDACLVISLTNCSLLPTDLMCSSCICVTNKGDNNEWLVNNKNGLLFDLTPDSICESLNEIYANEKKRKAIISRAYDYAITKTWEDEYKKVMPIFSII